MFSRATLFPGFRSGFGALYLWFFSLDLLGFGVVRVAQKIKLKEFKLIFGNCEHEKL